MTDDVVVVQEKRIKTVHRPIDVMYEKDYTSNVNESKTVNDLVLNEWRQYVNVVRLSAVVVTMQNLYSYRLYVLMMTHLNIGHKIALGAQ